jgi:hypothetical protein
MPRTRLYTVHVKQWSLTPDRDAVFIREGFAWGAALFSFFWAAAHRLWLAAVLLLGVSAAMALADVFLGLDEVTEMALGLGLAALIGWEANDWRRRKLEKQGYVEAGVVSAASLDEAERRFFAKAV